MSRASIRSRFRKLALLGVLFAAFFGARSSWAAPYKASPAELAVAKAATHAKRSQLAKSRERNERGQFLPKVNDADVQARAYAKYEARNRALGHVENGHDREDFLAAKRELQDEKMAQNKSLRAQRIEIKTVAAH
jgi:hypothetical protein